MGYKRGYGRVDKVIVAGGATFTTFGKITYIRGHNRGDGRMDKGGKLGDF